MSAIKYVGRTVWKVRIRYDYLSGRGVSKLLIATKGQHVHHGVRAATNFLFRNENYPNADIVSIKRIGQLDA